MSTYPDPSRIPVFSARRQITKVRGLTWLFLILCIVAFWYGYILYQTYGLAPGDGGLLRPLSERIAWGLGVAGLGLTAACGMLFYNILYIASVELDAKTQTVYITTMRPIGYHTFPVDVQDIQPGNLFLGQLETEGLSVNAPWYAVHITGRRLFYILDLQGQILDFEAAKSVFKIRIGAQKRYARK